MTDEQVKLAERMAISCLIHIGCSECPIRGGCHDGCANTFLRWFTFGELQELPDNEVWEVWTESRTLQEMFEDGDDP